MDFRNEAAMILASTIMVLLGFLFKYIKGKFEAYKYKKESSVEHQAQQNINILKKLIELRTMFDSMGVSIWQFHNGDFYLNNRSLMKMSMTHEDSDSQFKSFKELSQNWPISHYPELISKLLQNDFVVSDVDDAAIDNRSVLIFRGIKTIISFKLVKEGKMIGYCNIAFEEHKKLEDLNIKSLIDFKDQINYLLSENV